ncbi:MAG: aminotransferase class [Propionibacteriaceae bacterium]|jgi:isopenicillin-N epimerase|nr:aminotransferase class [Propionibacteriaceae bacterium]
MEVLVLRQLDPAAPARLRAADGSPAITGWALDPLIRHLNHGSFGGVPNVALAYQQAVRAQMESAPVAWFPPLPQRIAGVRGQLAPMLGIEPDRLALVPNASGGASVVFNSIQLSDGAEVLVTDHGYGAVTMGAARAARRVRGQLRVANVPLEADEDASFDAVWAAVTDRTELIVIDHITSPTARRLPVGRICAAARARGILTLVDGAHAPMMLPTAIADADADFWVGNLHKYGCAPRGTAVLIARPEVADLVYPLIDSWGGDLEYPERFDHQGTVDLTSWLAAPTALHYIEDTFGWDRVRSYTSDLAAWAQASIVDALSRSFGVDCSVEVGMPIGPIRLVKVPAPLAAAHLSANGLRDRMIAEAGIETAFTSFAGQGYFRLSAHAYNTTDDYIDFIERAIPLLVKWAHESNPEPPTINPEERREQ